jgi:putative membrane protein
MNTMGKKIENLMWILVALVSAVVAVAIIVSILFGGNYYNGTYGSYGMMGGFYDMGIIMPIIGMISVILVLLSIYFIFEDVRIPEPYRPVERIARAEEITKERFARGEISEAEYRQMIETIRR